MRKPSTGRSILFVTKLIKLLCSNFSFCSFNWVGREANTLAHSLAKSPIPQVHTFCCNKDSLPFNVWLRDSVIYYLISMNYRCLVKLKKAIKVEKKITF
jgi:hypothetical protein